MYLVPNPRVSIANMFNNFLSSPFPFQFDNSLITPGKYRQRSYDNLKMGKSQSSHRMQKHFSTKHNRIASDLSKIINEEQSKYQIQNNHKYYQSIRYRKLHRNQITDKMLLSSSSVKLKPLVPTHYKVYIPQKKYQIKNEYTSYVYELNSNANPKLDQKNDIKNNNSLTDCADHGIDQMSLLFHSSANSNRIAINDIQNSNVLVDIRDG